MKKFVLIGSVFLSTFNYAHADTVTVSGISGNFFSASGSLSSFLSSSFNASFAFGDNAAQASSFTLTPSIIPGNEYTSAFLFSGGSYGGSIGSNGQTLSSAFTDVRIHDNLTLSAADSLSYTNGQLPAGTYDLLEIGIGNTTGVCSPGNTCNSSFDLSSADGTDAQIYFALPGNWVSGGALPNPFDLSTRLGAVIQVQDYDANGNVIGQAAGVVQSLVISSVPLPASFWLFGPVLLAGLSGRLRSSFAA